MGAVALPAADASASRRPLRQARRAVDLAPRSWFARRRRRSRSSSSVGIAIVGLLMALDRARCRRPGRSLWENAHWTAAGSLAASCIAALVGHASATGPDRRIAIARRRSARSPGSSASSLWVAQTAVGYFNVPAPSDLGFLMLAPPIAAAFVIAVNGRLAEGEKVAVYLDAVAIFLAITGDHPRDLRRPDRRGRRAARRPLVAIAYPVVHLAAVRRRPRGAAGRAGLAAGRRLRPARSGSRSSAIAWVDWLRQAVVALPRLGQHRQLRASRSGSSLVGVGASDWRLGEGRRVARFTSGLDPRSSAACRWWPCWRARSCWSRRSSVDERARPRSGCARWR